MIEHLEDFLVGFGDSESADFPQQFRDFLIATGCRDTEDAVQSTLGFDLRTREFWDRSLDVVEQRVQQFLELASK
ncbi:MAG: hypothetical protein ACE1Y9_03855 [Acidimicrobiia bacterium]